MRELKTFVRMEHEDGTVIIATEDEALQIMVDNDTNYRITHVQMTQEEFDNLGDL